MAAVRRLLFLLAVPARNVAWRTRRINGISAVRICAAFDRRNHHSHIQYIMSSPDAPVIASLVASDDDRQTVHFGFENTYARLPEHFYARVDPTPVAAPGLVKVNVELARNLGLDPHALASEQGVM